MKKICLSILFISFFCSVKSQQWEWAKNISYTFNYPRDNHLSSDNNSNYYLTTGFDTVASCLLKLDIQGNELWRIYITGNIQSKGIAVYSSNIYITGTFSHSCQIASNTIQSAGATDIFLACFNSNGSLLWVRTFGGTGEDDSRDVTIGKTGMVYLTGAFADTVTFDSSTLICQGSQNTFIVKLDSAGNTLLAKSFAASTSDGQSTGRKIKIKSNDNIILLGGYEDILLDTNHFYTGYYVVNYLAELDPAFNVLWALPGNSSSTEETRDFDLDDFENILTAGYYAWTWGGYSINRKHGTNGQVLWQSNIGGTCYGDGAVVNCVAAMNNYSYSLGEISYSSNCAQVARSRTFVVKFDSNGNRIFLDSLNIDNNYSWGGYSYDIIKDAPDNLVVSGVMDGTMIFGIDTLIASNKIFIAKFQDNNATAIDSESQNFQISIFPNPTSGLLNIQCPTPNTELKIYNPLGSLIHQQIIKSPNQQINLSTQPKGIYFLEIISGNKREMKKIILQ